jgi:hypothetical protein
MPISGYESLSLRERKDFQQRERTGLSPGPDSVKPEIY